MGRGFCIGSQPEGAFRDTLTLAADGRCGSLLLESARTAPGPFATCTLRRLGAAAPGHAARAGAQ